MASFVTATVWGQGRAAIKLAGTLKEGEEECQICRNDVPATVSFKPCAHNVCFACVENMRAKNIFKADKGVRCPFCRSFVDGYVCVGQASPAVQKFLLEANKAASIAAAARRGAEPGMAGQQPLQQQQQQPRQQQQAQEQAQPAMRVMPQATASFSTDTIDMTWDCHACGTSNYLWRTVCGRCKKQIPPTLEQSLRRDHGKKDLLHVTKEELLELIMEKNHVGLNRAFFDVGLTANHNNYNKLSGSNASIAEAVASSGAKRLLRVVELLASDPAALRECSLHPFGNFGIQRLLECTSRLREVLMAAGRTSALAAFARAHHGRDPFAAMLAVMLPVVDTYLHNEKGVYVVQCLAANASNSELLAVARAVYSECLAVSKDPKGIFALIVLLEMLRDRCLSDSRTVEEAVAIADALCGRFADSGSALGHTAGHALSGHMLVVALQVAMPRHNALDMASKIASGARQLAQVPGGQQTLVELLQLHGHDHETAVALRDIAAGIAFSLQGTISKLALGRAVQTNYGAPSPQELLQALIERLADEQEVNWLDSIINELVGVCDQLVERPECIELLKVALSVNVLDLDLVTTHVSQMMSLLGAAKLKPVLDEVMDLVASRPPPPAPKYISMSAMQPELAYHLHQGHHLPAPPSPPARQAAGASAPAAAPSQPPQHRAASASSQPQQQPQQRAQQPVPQTVGASHAPVAEEEEVWPSNDASAADDWGQPAVDPASAAAGSGWGEPVVSPTATAAVAYPDFAAPPTASGHHPAQQQGSLYSQQSQQEAAAASFLQQPQQGLHQPAFAPVQQMQQPFAQPFSAPFSVPVPMPVPVPVPVPVAQPYPPASTATGAASTMPQAPPASTANASQPQFPLHMQVPIPIPMPVPAPAAAPRPQPQAAQPRTLLPPFLSIPVPQPVVAPAAASAAPLAARQAAQPQQWQAPQQQQQQQPQARHTPSPQPPSRSSTPPAGGVGRGGADAPAMRVPMGAQWACSVCTYVHSGPEAQFLMCALCGCEKGSS